MTFDDVSVLLVVYALAGLYALTVYAWLLRAGDDPTRPTSETFGLSIVLGVLGVAVANNYLASLIGSVGAAVVVLVLPIANLVCVVSSRRWRARVLDGLKATGRTIVLAGALCTVFCLSIGYSLFASQRLAADGTLYPDLPMHIVRTTQQAFQSTAGFVPLSPMAFPERVPFSAFVADSLVGTAFRYLPGRLEAFSYGQVMFGWVVVLLIAVVLIADPHPLRGICILALAMLAAPLIVWPMQEFAYIVYVMFHANPNSAIARPIALALAIHLYRAYLRKAPPFWPLVVFVPPASLFFKPNLAFSFGFLQVVGFAVWASRRPARGIVKGATSAAGMWMLAILLMQTSGAWPVSPSLRPAMENVWSYADVAIPGIAGHHSFRRLLDIFASYLAITGGVAAAVVLIRSRWRREGSVFLAVGREAIAPTLAVAAAIVYVLAGWWLIAPISTNGEPMHVNVELIVTVMTPPIALAVCSLFDRERILPRWSGVQRVATVFIQSVILALWVMTAWRLNTKPGSQGGLPLHFDYDIALEGKLRQALDSRMPRGGCYSYGRRFAIYVDGGFEPEFVMAALGCPVLNGDRWRGVASENDPDALGRSSTIPVSAGPPFQVVDIAPCTAPPGATGALATSATASTVQLAWAAAAGAASYVIEVGSASGLSDIAHLTTHAATSFTANGVSSGTYFTRVRAKNLCGVGAPSNEVTVVVR